MKPSPDHEARLEQLLQRAVRDLPPRPAPRSLEQRVHAEIARRAGLPWWRRSFAYWPAPARAGFLGLSLAAVAALVVSGFRIGDGLEARLPGALATPAAWLGYGSTVLRALESCVAVVERNIPPAWLYGGLAAVAAAYLTLCGLGAAVYRALQSQR